MPPLAVSWAIVSALDAQNHQAREARASEERDIRREAYLGYLEHATAYRYATSDLLDAIAEAGDADLPDPTAAFQRWLNARADFQDSVNSVYVYGSDEAWQRHRVVARTLPYSVGYINQSQLVDDLSKFRDEVQAFGAAYNDFLELMCEELPATPRDGCEP